MLNIWDNQVKQAKKNKEKLKDFLLQPIIPIIFYHLKSEWEVKPFNGYFTVIDKNLQGFSPVFKYQMIDLSKYPDAEITKRFQN